MKKTSTTLLLLLLSLGIYARASWPSRINTLIFSSAKPVWADTVAVKEQIDFLNSNSLNIPQQDSIFYTAIAQCYRSGLASYAARLLNFWSQIKISQDEIADAYSLIQQAFYIGNTNSELSRSVDFRDVLQQKSLAHFYKNEFDSSLAWAKKGLELSAAAKDRFNESVFTVQYAIDLSVNKGDTALIDSLFRRAYRLAQQTTSLHDDAMALHNYAYFQKAYPVQNLKTSLEVLLSVQDFSTADELTSNKAIAYHRSPFFFRGTHMMMLKELAYGYLYLGDFEQAVYYIEQCSKRQIETKNWAYLPRLLIEQAYFETYLKPADRIKLLYDSVIRLSVKYHGKQELQASYLYYVKGWLAETNKDWVTAARQYKIATGFGEFGINENQIGLFRTYVKSKDIVHADSLYNAISAGINSTLIQYYRIYFYKELPAYFRLKNDEVKALQANINYYHLKDSMAGIASYLIASRFEKQFKTKEKDRLLVLAEKERKLNRQQIALQKRQALFLGAGLLLFLLATILLIRNYRLKKKQAAVLLQKNNQIETLIRELHHRVKNNLQVVSGLLSLQANRLEDETARQAMDEGRTRVDAMAMIHQKLYMDKDLAAVDIKEYLENLSLSLANSFGYDKKNVDTTVELPSQSMDIDMAIPIGLIVNELVTNAFKHAFANTDSPRIRVHLSKKEEAMMELIVADNGKGITGKTTDSRSFGMKLVHTLVEQLNGTLQQEQENGTLYKIQIRA
jgi:two-component sensor histidine kinase